MLMLSPWAREGEGRRRNYRRTKQIKHQLSPQSNLLLTGFLAPVLLSGKLVMRSPVRGVSAQEATAEGSLRVPFLAGQRTQHSCFLLYYPQLMAAHMSTALTPKWKVTLHMM